MVSSVMEADNTLLLMANAESDGVSVNLVYVGLPMLAS